MNAFVEHHNNSIEFGYRCFDRLLLNGLIQPFQQPERVLGFFNTYREGKRVTRKTLTDIADQFQYWLKNRSTKWGAAVDEITQRLLDLNRNIGQPKKITTIFGRKVTKQYRGKLQSVIEDLDLPNPVIRNHYGHGFA